MKDIKGKGSKADGVNLGEIREIALGSLGGAQPRSIRKRGYHRALKRGEAWAISRKTYEELVSDVLQQLYCPKLEEYIMTNNPLLGLSQWLPEEKYEVKIEYGTTYFGLDRTTKTRFDLPPPPSLWSRIKSWFRR